MKVDISPSAEEQIVEAGKYYESCSHEIGVRFVDTIYREIDRLEHHGGVHAKRHGFHRVVARPFPYAIYYQIVNNVAVVRAVLDCRRDPYGIWQSLHKPS